MTDLTNRTATTTTPLTPNGPAIGRYGMQQLGGTCPVSGSTPNGTTTPPSTVADSMQLSDAHFISMRKEAYATLHVQEAEVLTMPWGPNIDVIFDPRRNAALTNGRVRLMGRINGGGEFEIATATIASVEAPIKLSGSSGCDEYFVKACSGTESVQGAPAADTHVFGRVYGH